MQKTKHARIESHHYLILDKRDVKALSTDTMVLNMVFNSSLLETGQKRC